ncbi:Oxoglutarate/iron-dependent dioxygenase [uncultured Caudovirales phage]|uniref:Oxoglutarate/iron-dependent dioxygenase n=1 Tax=uncultured Caudovirales phage TaxID=2100421 RepID=A0A6J7WNC6_9CAUD|nr:Oxoglutarate/iron-dependent dioxygenase [uncultured Caudovirales phage]
MEEIVHTSTIAEYKNYLTKKDCEFLIDYWNSLNSWQTTCFYGAEIAIPKGNHTPEAGRFLAQLNDRLLKDAEKFYNRELRKLSFGIQKWEKGAFAKPHSDNSDEDGNPNAWQENKLVTMLYLNNDYEGGHLFFPDHGIDIRPEECSMITFNSGAENIHGVSLIDSGTRYTMLASFDYADSVYPPEFYEQRDKEKLIEDKRKIELEEGWKKGIL